MTKREYLETGLRQEMTTAGVDAVIGVSPENVQHLAGVFIISQRMISDRLAFAVYRRTGAPFFVVSTVVEHTARTQSWIDEIAPFKEHAVLPIDGLVGALKERGLDRGRIWIEMGYLPGRDADALRRALPDLEILDAETVLNRSRMVKTDDEIRRMTEIAGIWETAVEAGYRATKAGESERSIAHRLAHNLLDGGADWVPFYSFASGPERTMIAHSVPDDTRVGRGQIVRLDMVGFFRGYYTDYGRMAVVGEASPAQRDAYQKLVTLQREMITRMQPGRRGSDLYRESVAVGKELGLEFSMDAIGHSLGLRLHEYPILNPYEEETLVPNMLMCVEIMHPFKGLGRFHVEDLVRVREGGGERLTTKMDTSTLMIVG